MKVILKKPGQAPAVIEVSGIAEINQLVGNVNPDGTGYAFGGTDIREPIGHKVDMYCKADAVNNFALGANLWNKSNMHVLFGNLVFAGYDRDLRTNAGACDLTDEQIEYCLHFIATQTAD